MTGEISLLRCDVADVLREIEPGSASLVHADPPWGAYRQRAGKAHPELDAPNGYRCLGYDDILEHLHGAYAATAPGGRLVMWYTWPLAGEIVRAGLPGGGWTYKTGGAWMKVPHHGPGYHWSGCSEPVSVYTRPGAAAWRDTKVPLRNAWASKPGKHSVKPDEWLEMMVRRWVPPGGLVVDLYAGLGGMARAVLRAGEGRQYIGAEIDETRWSEAVRLLGEEGVGDE